MVLHVDELMVHLGDTLHEWMGLSHIERVDWYELCLPGLCMSPYLSGSSRAWEMIRLVGLSEQIGGLPVAGGWYDQPNSYVEACGVIRSTRNQIQERNFAAAQRNAKSR